MSHFSAVDDSPDPTSLVRSLDASARWLGAMKAYVASAASLAVPGGCILDLGCGVGHDLGLLGAAGLRPVGLDASRHLLDEAARRLGREVPLVRADGGALPFRTGSLDGCRIERVLQHVADPTRILDEVARVIRGGGFIAVFEPDWTSWSVDTAVDGAAGLAAVLHRPRQPDIGRRLPGLVAAAGFEVVDVVTEASVIRSLERVPVSVEAGLDRAVADGLVDRSTAGAWMVEQRELEAAGRVELHQSKVLIVAERPGGAGAT